MSRFLYWTIIIGDQPTSFRAREAADLQPTLVQLQRTHPDAKMKWFERGRLWASPEEAHAAREAERRETRKRPATWRPGGRHEDPRQKYKDAKKAKWTRFKDRIRERHEAKRSEWKPRPTPPPGPVVPPQDAAEQPEIRIPEKAYAKLPRPRLMPGRPKPPVPEAPKPEEDARPRPGEARRDRGDRADEDRRTGTLPDDRRPVGRKPFEKKPFGGRSAEGRAFGKSSGNKPFGSKPFGTRPGGGPKPPGRARPGSPRPPRKPRKG